MGREILLKGDTINGKFLYEIEDVSGTGASCVVYKARYYDDKEQKHLVQIKEFYPYDLEICREKNSNNLICTDAEQFETEKCRFINNAKKLASFNNDETTNSGTPYQVEIFETNQTAYSVVAYDAGDICSEENLQTMELAKLLEIVKNLTRAVGLLHKNGYIHLDIKPENFLVDNTEHITLFDIDSVVLCNELNSENIDNISYSKKWAAPEVKHAAEKGDYKDISCKVDIFSVGVLLFEGIMRREFLPMETVSYNRNWDIEESIKIREGEQNREVNINPKFYHQIKEVFEKTLDRNPNNRYKDAKELYEALDKAHDLLKEKPWIIPSFRTVTPQFTGRRNELAKMNSILRKENTVFLHGFGGMGKSELALKYAEIYKNDFDTVVFCKYEDSIKEALLNIQIANFESDSNAMTLRKFAELCDERTLIILDNFDVETDADDYVDDFINNYNCKKIITTRTDFSELYTQLDVDALVQDDAILLFEKESKWIPKTVDEEKTINEMLKLIGYHTYFTVILAKKKEMFSLSIDELKKQTEEILLKKSGKVTVAKDGKLTTSTIDAMARKLFDFNSITESQIQTLRNLYMLSWRTVSRNDYTEIAGYGMSAEEKIELKDSLNDLTRLGWVLYNEKVDDFFLHPIMQGLVKENCIDNSYCPDNIVEYYKNSLSPFVKFTISDANSVPLNIICYKCNNLIDSIYRLIVLLVKNLSYNTEVVIGLLLSVRDVNIYLRDFCMREKKKEFIDVFNLIESIDEIKTNKQLLIQVINLKLFYISAKGIGINEINIFIREANKLSKLLELKPSASNDKKKFFWEAVECYVSYFSHSCPKDCWKHFNSIEGRELKANIELVKDIMNKRDLEKFLLYQANFDSYIETGKPVVKFIDTEEKDFSSKFKKFDELSKDWVLGNFNLPNFDRKKLEIFFEYGIDIINATIMGFENTDINRHADFLVELFKNLPDGFFHRRNWAYKVLIRYAQDRSSLINSIKNYMHEIKEQQKKSIGKSHNDFFVFTVIRGLFYAFCDCGHMHKVFDFIYEYLNNEIKNVSDEDTIFQIYEFINRMASMSYKETNNEYYLKIANEYQSKMNHLSGKDYEIKD